MTISITAEVDGQTFAVEPHRITGLDALAFRVDVGQEIDAVILEWLEAGEVPALLADLAVAKWLWLRQNGQPLVSLASVAASVTLLPEPDDEAA